MFKKFQWRHLTQPYIIGVDEVGRGCLAGPVYAACAILNPAKKCSQFKDSKLLTPDRRESLVQVIERDHQATVAFATSCEIDRINILRASLLAMRRAFVALDIPKSEWAHCHLLVDGNQKVPDLPGVLQTCLIKGDMRAEPIGAASIFAKVHRDRRMVELHKQFPQYGFGAHKGYATKEHREAIRAFGPIGEHRRSFSGVKEFLEPSSKSSSMPGIEV